MWGSVQPNECWIDFGASCNTSWWGNRPQHGNSYHAMVESLHQLVLIRMCHLLPKFMNPSFHLPSSLPCSMRMDVYCAGASSPTPKQGGRRHPGASPFYLLRQNQCFVQGFRQYFITSHEMPRLPEFAPCRHLTQP